MPCNIFELRSTLAKPAVVVLSYSQTAQRFEDIRVCINGFSQFFYVPNEVRLLSPLLNERFALGLGQLRLTRRS